MIENYALSLTHTYIDNTIIVIIEIIETYITKCVF